MVIIHSRLSLISQISEYLYNKALIFKILNFLSFHSKVQFADSNLFNGKPDMLM